MARPKLEWTGEYDDVEITEWWCPTLRQWVFCDDVCPDGRPHRVKRIRATRAKVLRRVDDQEPT